MPIWMPFRLAIALLLLLVGCTAPQLESTPPSSPSDRQDAAQEATSPQPAEGEATSSSNIDLPATLVEDLKSILSARTGLSATEISFQSAVSVDWPDACLGIVEPDVACAQVVTPGYRVTFNTLTETYEFHTDRSGETVRLVRPSIPSGDRP